MNPQLGLSCSELGSFEDTHTCTFPSSKMPVELQLDDADKLHEKLVQVPPPAVKSKNRFSMQTKETLRDVTRVHNNN